MIVLFVLMSIWGRAQELRKRRQGALAIVTISGPIRIDTGRSAWSSSDAEEVARQLHEYSEDKDVKAILLRINSPGGTVGAVQEIYREMERCRSKGIKIVASLGEVAASGGYYLAAGSDRIVSNPGTITGSIGVIIQFGNLETLFQKVGVKMQIIKSGAHKDIGSPSRALTPEERALIQSSIDDAYAQFVDVVQKGRQLKPEQLKELTDGRIFTGRQAMKWGLVDEMGNLQDAIQVAIQLAKLPSDPFIISERKHSLSTLLQKASSSFSPLSWDAIQGTISGTQVEYQWRL